MRRRTWRIWVRAVVGLLLVVGVVPAGATAGARTADAVRAPRGNVWLQVSAGDRHTCGITLTGRLFCWGSDAAGQLGDGGTNTDQAAPVEIAGPRKVWVQVSAGGFHTCARTIVGQLYCWGSDFWGQRGDGGANTDVGEPVRVTAGATAWADVSAGYQHTCARSVNRHLWCWGNDGSGRLGDDAAVADRTEPVEVAGATADWRAVTAGIFHTCAIRTSGRLFCWGLDSAGQLGDGPPLTEQHTPVEVAGGRTDWTAVALGRSHTCGLGRTGSLHCWGWDDAGQLGDDAAHANQAVPVPVAGETRWRAVAAGGYHTCAIGAGRHGAGGTVSCWGLDTYGALGDDAALADQPVPRPVAASPQRATTLTAGEYHTCSTLTPGRLSCWGLDSNGQVGDGGTNTDQPTPVPVAG